MLMPLCLRRDADGELIEVSVFVAGRSDEATREMVEKRRIRIIMVGENEAFVFGDQGDVLKE